MKIEGTKYTNKGNKSVAIRFSYYNCFGLKQTDTIQLLPKQTFEKTIPPFAFEVLIDKQSA